MPERPRVLQVGPAPEIGGGMAASLAALLASPLGQRYRLDVVATYRGRQPLRRLAVYCLALVRLFAWSLCRRGAVVHVHATVRGSAYRKSVCVLLARLLRRRVVLQIHSGPGDIAAFRSGLGRPSLALFSRALAAADAVLAVSAASATALAEAGVEAEIEVVPNPAPPAPSFVRVDPSDGTVRVAYLGGFANPIKGGEVLLEALETVVAEEPRLRMTLAGPGELPARGRALCEGAAAVEWAGWLDAAAKDALLRDAPIFVMPSLSEGLPMALLEAMAYGMAPVATRVGGIPELVEDGVEGLLVEPGDPAALAAALLRLAADPELRGRLAPAARARAERLDAVEVAGRLQAIYARLG
jgi:glycosyltransferase involved in cell wall biosynthesis